MDFPAPANGKRRSKPVKSPSPMTSLRAIALRGAAALALISLFACRRNKPQMDPRALAVINGEVVTRVAFENELHRELSSFSDSTPPSPEQLQATQQALLDTVIDRVLLLQEARRKGVAVAPEEVNREMQKISGDFADDGGFAQTLAEGQLSLEELRHKTEDFLTVEKLLQQEVYARAAATEAEIAQYYEAHRAEFERPEQVRMRQIVVNSKEEAAKLLAELRAGAKFEELARKHSLSADAKTGGDLGFFPRGVMPAVFDEVAFRLSPGQLSDVVTSDYGFHLFKVVERTPSQKQTLVEARARVEKRLLESKRRAAQQEYVNALRARAQLQVQKNALVNARDLPPVEKSK